MHSLLFPVSCALSFYKVNQLVLETTWRMAVLVSISTSWIQLSFWFTKFLCAYVLYLYHLVSSMCRCFTPKQFRPIECNVPYNIAQDLIKCSIISIKTVTFPLASIYIGRGIRVVLVRRQNQVILHLSLGLWWLSPFLVCHGENQITFSKRGLTVTNIR